MKIARKTALFAAVSILTFVPDFALAADAVWTGASFNSSFFFNPGNWQGNFIPGAGDRANFFPPASSPWTGPLFGAGTVTNSQMLIVGQPPAGAWQFVGGSAGENWKITNDLTLNPGSNAVFNGVDVFAGTTNIATGCFVGIVGTTTYQSSTINTQGSGFFIVNSGNTLRGGLSAQGVGTSTVDGLFDASTFDILGGGQLTVGSTGSLVINADSQVSNGTLLINNNGSMSAPTGARLRITGNSSTLRFAGSHMLADKTNLDVRAGGDVVVAGFIDVGNGATGIQTVDGAGSTITATGNSDWGLNSTGLATVTFSNSGAGTYETLRLADVSGGRADASLLSSSQLTTTSNLAVGPSSGTSSLARMTINGGALNSNGVSQFRNGGQLVLSTGTANFNGDVLFSAGSTFSISGGSVKIASGKTFNIDGGVVTRTGGWTGVPDGVTLRITNGGKLTSNSFFDVANANSTGTMLVSGANSQVVSTNDVSDFGATAGNFATVTFSSNGVGSFAALRVGNFGGKALVNLNTAGQLNTNSLTAGGSFSGSAATINIAGGTLNCIGSGVFNTGAVVALSDGGLILNDITLFNTGASLTRNGGAITLTPGRTLAFDGGVGSINGNFSLSNGSTLRVTSGGRFDLNSYFDVASNNAAGTLLVNGAGSRVTTLGVTASDWASNAGNTATVTFSNSGAGTYSGLRLAINGGSALVNLNTGGNLTVGSLTAGSSVATSAATINIAGGSLNITSNATLSLGAQVNYSTGKFGVGGTLTMTNSAKVLLTSGGDKVVRVGGLSLQNTSKIDLSDNDMIVDYAGASPLTSVRGFIITGRNGGNWLGNGLTSSSAAADPTHKSLGIGEASVVLGASGGTFSGQSVDATTVLVKFTYLGDANLDGKVDVADLGALASHWQQNGVWTDGDSNYSGFIDVADLGLLATNWQAGVGNPLGPTFAEALAALGLPNISLPEPACSVVGAVSVALLRRRRRSESI